ncbi:MAG: prolyl oligopeptidase family serine peptidase, partial [Anaerolineae bacterium]|nr:prolyl oligopeptidase family serine peptidase [Anaerolineae bacterium]
GGSITLWAMVVTDDIKAGVIWAGVVGSYTDILERWRRRIEETPTPDPTWIPDPNDSRRRWRQELLDTYGSPEENPAFWRSISPNAYLADLSGPVQLHHGTADTSVPIEYSESLYTQIQEVGKPVELYTYKDDNHNIANNLSTALQLSIQFFDRYVKGEDVAAADK